MSLKNLDHLLIKSKEEQEAEYREAIREKCVELLEWSQNKGLTTKDLATVCFNIYKHYMEETTELNSKDKDESTTDKA